MLYFCTQTTNAGRTKYKTVIIGLGTIAHYHVAGLQRSEQFDLCAVCDLREETAHNPLWSNLPFYRDYETMLTAVRPDVAIIATPPAAHYTIAETCIAHRVKPFVEKPLAATQEEGNLFFADKLTGKYVPICHTLYGPEMLWLTNHLPLQKIDAIRMTLNDPYADKDGQIAERFKTLGGCWLDSAPNALSPLLRIVPSIENVIVQHMRDKRNGLPYASLLTAQHNKTEIIIDIAWHRAINHKQTEIEADGKHILIDHSAQAVFVNEERAYTAQGDRLTQQYTNFYRLYPHRVPKEEIMKYMYNIIYSNR